MCPFFQRTIDSTYRLLHDFYCVPCQKIYLIPNCLYSTDEELLIGKKEARKILHLNENEKVLLFVGRTSKAKGMFELLKAFERICNTYDNVRLVIVGEVNSLEIFTKLTPTSSTRITYTGLINSELLDLWYASADIGILPSYTEQCSYTALEMMHSPGVVVTTNGWGLDEVFNDKNAIIASQQRKSNEIEAIQFTDSLYTAINKALNLRQNKSESLKVQCRNLLKNSYNIDKASHEYLKLINNITSKV